MNEPEGTWTIVSTGTPIITAVAAVVAICMVACLVTAWRSRRNPDTTKLVVAVLGHLAGFVLALGFSAYAWHALHSYLPHGVSPESDYTAICNASAIRAHKALAHSAFVAALGFLAATAVRILTKGHRQQSVGGDSDKAADGLTGAPQR